MGMAHKGFILSLFKINFAKFLTYRTDFFINMFDTIVWFLVSLLFYRYIYSYSSGISGISANYMYTIVATSEIVKGLLFTFCIDNLPSLPRIIRNGDLDIFLLKPISSQFLVSFRNISFGNLSTIIPAVVLILWNVKNISVQNTFVYIVLIIISFLLAYSIWFIIMTSSIWLIKAPQLHELFLGLLSLNQFPQRIFYYGNRTLYYLLLPILMTANFPASYINSTVTHQFSLILYTIFSLFILLISHLFWNFSVKYYSSASS